MQYKSNFIPLSLNLASCFSADIPEHKETTIFRSADRLPERFTEIEKAFQSVRSPKESHWSLYNGVARYNLCNIPKIQLLTQLVKDNTNQQEFYILDLEDGNAQWVDKSTTIHNGLLFPRIRERYLKGL